MLGTFQLGTNQLGATEVQPSIPLAHAQAQAFIPGAISVVGQSQALIVTTVNIYGQSQGLIAPKNSHGQTQAWVSRSSRGYGQSRAKIDKLAGYGQSRAWIKTTTNRFAQSRAKIIYKQLQSAQAEAQIWFPNQNAPAQAAAEILSITKVAYGQAVAFVWALKLYDTFTRTTELGASLGNPDIGPPWQQVSDEVRVDGSVLLFDDEDPFSFTQASFGNSVNVTDGLYQIDFQLNDTDQGNLTMLARWFGDYLSVFIDQNNEILRLLKGGTANQDVVTFLPLPGVWYTVAFKFVGSEAWAKVWELGTDEPDWMVHISDIPLTGGFNDTIELTVTGIEPARIDNVRVWAPPITIYKHAQSQARIRFPAGFGQARALIEQGFGWKHAQSNALIRIKDIQIVAQAGGWIERLRWTFAQSRAVIVDLGFVTQSTSGNAQAFIHRTQGYAQALGKLTGGTSYYVKDTFSRTTNVGDPFGTPDVGPAYDAPNGNSNFAHMDGSVLILNGIGNFDHLWAINPINAENVDITLDAKTSAWMPWATLFWVEARMQNGINPSRIYETVYYDPDVNEMVVTTNIPPFPTVNLPVFDVDTWYTARYSVDSTNGAKFKVWKTSDSEPGTWLIETSADPNVIGLQTGKVGFYADIGENPTEFVTVEIDNYFVLNPAGGVVPEIFRNHGQAGAYIARFPRAYGQARARILANTVYAQSESWIKRTSRNHGLAQAFIVYPIKSGQARAVIIRNMTENSGQSQAWIVKVGFTGIGLARALVVKGAGYGQSQAQIFVLAQNNHGQARALVSVRNIRRYAQARAKIYDPYGPRFGQAQALIKGGRYTVNYNGMYFPGYAQFEEMSSPARLERHAPTYEPVSSEFYGLWNKVITIRMMVIGRDYEDAKEQVREAATILHSSRTFAKLYVGFLHRYYEALGMEIIMEKIVGTGMRKIEYTIRFHVKPWLFDDTSEDRWFL